MFMVPAGPAIGATGPADAPAPATTKHPGARAAPQGAGRLDAAAPALPPGSRLRHDDHGHGDERLEVDRPLLRQLVVHLGEPHRPDPHLPNRRLLPRRTPGRPPAGATPALLADHGGSRVHR